MLVIIIRSVCAFGRKIDVQHAQFLVNHHDVRKLRFLCFNTEVRTIQDTATVQIVFVKVQFEHTLSQILRQKQYSFHIQTVLIVGEYADCMLHTFAAHTVGIPTDEDVAVKLFRYF